VLHKHALGDLEGQGARRKPGRSQRREDVANQVRVLELAGGEAHGDRDVQPALLLPIIEESIKRLPYCRTLLDITEERPATIPFSHSKYILAHGKKAYRRWVNNGSPR